MKTPSDDGRQWHCPPPGRSDRRRSAGSAASGASNNETARSNLQSGAPPGKQKAEACGTRARPTAATGVERTRVTQSGIDSSGAAGTDPIPAAKAAPATRRGPRRNPVVTAENHASLPRLRGRVGRGGGRGDGISLAVIAGSAARSNQEGRSGIASLARNDSAISFDLIEFWSLTPRDAARAAQSKVDAVARALGPRFAKAVP